MRVIRCPLRRNCVAGLIHHRPHSIQIVCLARDQDFQIIRQADEAAIKHPMRGARKCDAIVNDVWPIRLNRSNVSGRNFCPSHSIDELQPGNGTTLIISAQYDTAKDAIAQNSRDSQTNTIALLFEPELHLCLIEIKLSDISIKPRQQRCTLGQTEFAYSVEIVRRDWPDCRLGTPRNSSLLIQDAPLHRTIWPVERNRIGKVEITSGFNQGEIHSRNSRVGNDLLNTSYRKVATRFSHLARFIVDDPIADAGFDAAQVLARKLILFSGTVIVDRVRPMDEYPKSHDYCGVASPGRNYLIQFA